MWMQWMKISPFILFSTMTRNAFLQQHYECWLAHLEWIKIILTPSLSMDDIKKGKQKCIEWRTLMVKLFSPFKDLKFPKFHLILHLIDQISHFGPPYLFWTKYFEQKHKTFKGYIDRSNHRQVEIWSIEQG